MQSLRKLSGFSIRTWASRFGLTERQIRRYESGETPTPYPTQFLAETVARFDTAINERDTFDQAVAKFKRSMCDYMAVALGHHDQATRVAHALWLSNRATVAEAIAAGERHVKQPGVPSDPRERPDALRTMRPRLGRD